MPGRSVFPVIAALDGLGKGERGIELLRDLPLRCLREIPSCDYLSIMTLMSKWMKSSTTRFPLDFMRIGLRTVSDNKFLKSSPVKSLIDLAVALHTLGRKPESANPYMPEVSITKVLKQISSELLSRNEAGKLFLSLNECFKLIAVYSGVAPGEIESDLLNMTQVCIISKLEAIRESEHNYKRNKQRTKSVVFSPVFTRSLLSSAHGCIAANCFDMRWGNTVDWVVSRTYKGLSEVSSSVRQALVTEGLGSVNFPARFVKLLLKSSLSAVRPRVFVQVHRESLSEDIVREVIDRSSKAHDGVDRIGREHDAEIKKWNLADTIGSLIAVSSLTIPEIRTSLRLSETSKGPVMSLGRSTRLSISEPNSQMVRDLLKRRKQIRAYQGALTVFKDGSRGSCSSNLVAHPSGPSDALVYSISRAIGLGEGAFVRDNESLQLEEFLVRCEDLVFAINAFCVLRRELALSLDEQTSLKLLKLSVEAKKMLDSCPTITVSGPVHKHTFDRLIARTVETDLIGNEFQSISRMSGISDGVSCSLVCE